MGGFILAFVILAPLLIFYTSGYRYDFKRGKILKTGTLMVEAKDIKKADLYLNNQLYPETFNNKIFVYNLLPGEYNVRLEKIGYHPWQKKITINSGLTTFTKDITLFKSTLPIQIIDGKINSLYISPDLTKIVYGLRTDTFAELYLYNFETKERNLLYRTSLDNDFSVLSWAASSKKILVQINGQYLIFDVINLKLVQNLNDLLTIKPLTVKWDISSDNLLYAAQLDLIQQIDLVAKKSQLFFQPKEGELNSEFFIEANDVYYIQNTNNQDTLFKYNLNFKTNKKLLDLNLQSTYRFIPSTNNYLGLIDLDHEKFYLIKKIMTETEVNIKGEDQVKNFDAKNAIWDAKEKKLLIYNDFEIYTYDTESGQQNLINRYGQIIEKATWYPNLSYILVQFADHLEIIDLSLANGTTNTTQLVKFDQISTFYLDQKGKYLYYNGNIGKQQGLYQLNLK
jgi:hypothetical protein